MLHNGLTHGGDRIAKGAFEGPNFHVRVNVRDHAVAVVVNRLALIAFESGQDRGDGGDRGAPRFAHLHPLRLLLLLLRSRRSRRSADYRSILRLLLRGRRRHDRHSINDPR